MHNEAPKILFVINPISGGKEKTDWEVSIREYFSGKPHVIEFYILNGRDDKSSLRHYIQLLRPARVVAVGGDGTVKMLAEMLKETTVQLGILPAGSANGMAKELDIPLDPEEALQIIEHGKPKQVDLIRINEEEICLHLSDLGLNAMLVKSFEQSSGRGMWGYGRSVLQMLFQKRKMNVNIEIDGKTIKRSAYMVALANARKYGTGANINPDGNIADGIFEVVVIRKINLLEIYKSIFTNRSFHPRRIEIFPARDVKIQTNRRVHFQVDGEYKGKFTKIEARILKGVLNLVLPVEKADLA